MDIARKLKRRIMQPSRFFAKVMVAFAAQLKKKKRKATGDAVLEAIRNRPMDRDQWRRWYQVNTKMQRQLRAMKQRGGNFKINPNATGIPRWMVA